MTKDGHHLKKNMNPDDELDFTHPDYVPHPPRPGIPYHPTMTPQQRAGQLLKVARKAKTTHPAAGKTVARPGGKGAPSKTSYANRR